MVIFSNVYFHHIFLSIITSVLKVLLHGLFHMCSNSAFFFFRPDSRRHPLRFHELHRLFVVKAWGIKQNIIDNHMGVSKNRGTPKSSILIGFPLYKPPILGYPYFWKYIYIIIYIYIFFFVGGIWIHQQSWKTRLKHFFAISNISCNYPDGFDSFDSLRVVIRLLVWTSSCWTSCSGWPQD